MAQDQELYWRGKPVSSMSREELIEVIQAQHRQLEGYSSPVARVDRALGRVERVKRGL